MHQRTNPKRQFVRINAAMLITAIVGAAICAPFVTAASEDTRAMAFVAIGLFGLLAVAALFGFARLKVRGMTIVSCGLLAIAGGGGCATLALMDANPLAIGPPTLLCLAAFFAELGATNLLPDSSHPFVVGQERRLAAMSPPLRRRYLVTWLGAGLGLSAVAALASLVSLSLRNSRVFTVFTRAFAFGLIIATLPLLGELRRRARGKVPSVAS